LRIVEVKKHVEGKEEKTVLALALALVLVLRGSKDSGSQPSSTQT
jgi:hypothetical protein